MKLAITGASLRNEDERGLLENGFEVLKIPPCAAISGSVGTHADTVLFLLRDRLFLPRDYYNENSAIVSRILKKGGFVPVLTSSLPCSPYPFEIPLCALNAGDGAVIANEKHLAPEIAEYCKENGIPIYNTRQGYAKCTAAYAKGIISADSSILRAAELASIPNIKISQGSVMLDGYDYGFIGGASGFDGENLFFCGDLSLHPDSERILSFCKELSVNCVSLSSLPLHDVGSIFFI